MLGIPSVPTRASFWLVLGIYPTCATVGTLGSLSPTAIGTVGLAGDTDRRVLPAAFVVASVYAVVSSLSVLRAVKLAFISVLEVSQGCNAVKVARVLIL